MKSNTILACSLIISAVATATASDQWETTYARYHRNLSKSGKGESFGSKSTKSPTITTSSSGSKSNKGSVSKASGSKASGSKSSKSSGQTLTLEVSKLCVRIMMIYYLQYKI